jgi:sterol-4alpha-carboxylate 3-dehydrogenase (decarboxylating)
METILYTCGFVRGSLVLHHVMCVPNKTTTFDFPTLVHSHHFKHSRLKMAHDNSSGPKTAIPSVLIVGANGFLGRTMPPLIATRHPNCKINLLDIAPETSLGYPYFRGDITDLPSLIEIFQKVKPAVVIHSASPPIPTIGQGDPALFFRVNVEGTRNIINACNETGVRALIYTSSASVIYDGGSLVNADEKTPFATRHVDPYNASKVPFVEFLAITNL